MKKIDLEDLILVVWDKIYYVSIYFWMGVLLYINYDYVIKIIIVVMYIFIIYYVVC